MSFRNRNGIKVWLILYKLSMRDSWYPLQDPVTLSTQIFHNRVDVVKCIAQIRRDAKKRGEHTSFHVAHGLLRWKPIAKMRVPGLTTKECGLRQ